MKKRIFSQEFINAIPDDEVEALKHICEGFETWRNTKPAPYDYLDVYSFLLLVSEIRKLPIKLPPPTFREEKDLSAMNSEIGRIIHEIAPKLKDRGMREIFTKAQDFYQTSIPGGFVYEFLDTDYKRLQELVNELRTLTNESKKIETGHKRRLLKRIEKLQQELNKRMSNVDIFWSFLGDAGVVLGKFGTDIKPLTDRICEILKIVMSTQFRAEGLPPATEYPLLPRLDHEKNQE